MTLLFLGDISLNNEIQENLVIKEHLPFEHLINSFQKYDKVIGNIETPITSIEHPIRNKVTLKSNSLALKHISEANIKLLSVANNHILDYGLEGYYETIECIKKNNIDYFGDEKNTYKIISYKSKNIALIGFCLKDTSPLYSHEGVDIIPEVDDKKIESIFKEIESLDIDYKVIYVHWGDEHIHYPNGNQKKFAEKFIDHGADLVIGHHPHVVQNYTKYKNKKIYYSLGNFIFADIKSKYESRIYRAKQFNSNKWSIGLEIDIRNGELLVVDTKYYKINSNNQVLPLESGKTKEMYKVKFFLINMLAKNKLYTKVKNDTKIFNYLFRNFVVSEDKNIFSQSNVLKIKRRLRHLISK